MNGYFLVDWNCVIYFYVFVWEEMIEWEYNDLGVIDWYLSFVMKLVLNVVKRLVKVWSFMYLVVVFLFERVWMLCYLILCYVILMI